MDEIEHELVSDVLVRTLWMSPEDVEIRVHEGEVTLLGTTETRSTAQLLETFARRVPGVVAVRSELLWTIDDLDRSTRHAAGPPRTV